MSTRTKCTGTRPCRHCKELQKLGVILRKNYKHTVSDVQPEPSQHDAHIWRARIVCPVKNIDIPPKFKRGKRV
jgi:hypothetical protein